MKKFNFMVLTIICFFVFGFINVNAKEMSDAFEKYLDKDGNLIVKSYKVPEDVLPYVFEYNFLTDENGEYADTGICWDNFNSDYTAVDFTINCFKEKPETHRVKISYVYNKDIKKMVDELVKAIPEDLKFFEVSDMEMVNYWVNGQGENANLLDYSTQYKEMFGHKNFSIDARAGGGDIFGSHSFGPGIFAFDGTIYYIKDRIGTAIQHKIYIPEDTKEDKDVVKDVVQKRIDEYVGKGKVKVAFGGDSIYNMYMDEYDAEITHTKPLYEAAKLAYEEAIAIETEVCAGSGESDFDANACIEAQNVRNEFYWKHEAAKTEYQYALMNKESFLEYYNNPEQLEYQYRSALNGWYYTLTVGDEVNYFFVVKDDDKMINPTAKTSDIGTNITISTNSSLIPLDTFIEVSKLTEGKEYEELLEILKVTDSETFDINLYSNTLGKYITKLDDGNFEVRIPLKEEFKGKDLIVYYVDDNDKIVDYDVDFSEDGNYAIFTTNHFSIYTLAEKKVEEVNKEEKVPQTYDGVTMYLVSGLVSIIGLVGVGLYLKKQNN